MRQGRLSVLSGLLAVCLLGVSGCQPTTTAAGEENRDKPVVVASTDQKQVESTVSANVGKSGGTSTAEKPFDRSDNPSRINQLNELKIAEVKLGKDTYKLWLMDTDSKRQEGMMFLRPGDVKPLEGMLFVFRETQVNDGLRGFWMKNCTFDIDILYVDEKGKVVSVHRGVAGNETPLPPGGDYRYVIELMYGQAKKQGIQRGSVISLPKGLSAS